MCKKVKHSSHFAALKHLKALGGKGATYYCAGCNAYHVTSNNKGGNFLKFKSK